VADQAGREAKDKAKRGEEETRRGKEEARRGKKEARLTAHAVAKATILAFTIAPHLALLLYAKCGINSPTAGFLQIG
jgi:hypothetical protein